MSHLDAFDLSRRERQVMSIVFELGEATATEVQDRLPDELSNSAVRWLLRTLIDKGLLKRRQDGPRFVYRPKVPRNKAVRSAVDSLIRTFFHGSPADALVALLDLKGTSLSPEQLEELSRRIAKVRKKGN